MSMQVFQSEKRFPKRLFFFFILFISGQHLYSQSYFNQIGDNEANQWENASKIYYKDVINLDSVKGCKALEELNNIAQKEENNKLQSLFFVLSGNFYYIHHNTKKGIENLQKAIDYSAKYSSCIQTQILAYEELGKIKYEEHQDLEAFKYMLKADEIVQTSIGYKNYTFSSRFLTSLGTMYYASGNFKQAREYLQNASQYPFNQVKDKVNLYNTIALTFQQNDELDSAFIFFKEALKIAQSNHLSAWVGICTGNIGAIYYHQLNYKEAVPLLTYDVNRSIENAEWASAASAAIILADIDIKQNHFLMASKWLDSAAKLNAREPTQYNACPIYSLKASLFKQQRQPDSAFFYLLLSSKLQDSIVRNNNLSIVNQAEKKVELEKYLSQLKLIETENKSHLNERNCVVLLFLLLLLIAAHFIYRLRIKRKKDRQTLQEAKRQLQNYAENLLEKNHLIQSFKEEIENLHTLPDFYQQKERDEIADKLKKYTILTEEHWNEFRHLFGKVHKQFLQNLRTGYGELTPAETRLLMLMKLDLSKTEMAEMLGVSPDSVKKTRQRINRKIQLPDDMSLEDVVRKL